MSNKIENNNRMLARFMGINTIWFSYDTSWNYLIPVVDKIETLTAIDGRGKVNFIVTIESNYCVISQGGEATVIESQSTDRIGACYDACCQFVEWYNKNRADYEK